MEQTLSEAKFGQCPGCLSENIEEEGEIEDGKAECKAGEKA